MTNVNFKLTRKQTEAHEKLINDKNTALLYGGAKGGGKSFLLCLWAVVWLYKLVEFFDIKKPKFPVPLGFIGRKRAVDFNDTTLETFKKIIPADMYHIKPHDKDIVFNDLNDVPIAKICYGGLDDPLTINKFNSAEYAFLGIDQAEETVRDDISVLQASLRFTYNGKTPPYKELYTANPAECWLKEDFILGNRKNTVFVPALPDDNPYLPENYKETLRSAFAHDPALLKAYLEGDWDAFSNLEDALFNANSITKCRNNDSEDNEEDAIRILGNDIATKHGDSFTVHVYRYGHTISDIQMYKHVPTTQIAFNIKKEYEKRKAQVCVVDSDGFGEGVSDVLISNNLRPLEFHGGWGSDALDKRHFKNMRSQFYYIVAKKMEKGMYCLKHLPQDIYEELKRQMCVIKVKPPDSKMRIQIETKEDMRARGVKSPDLADAFVYAEYGFWMGRFGDIQGHSYR